MADQFLVVTYQGRPYPDGRNPAVVATVADRPGIYRTIGGLAFVNTAGPLLPGFDARPASTPSEHNAIAAAHSREDDQANPLRRAWGLPEQHNKGYKTPCAVFAC